MTKTLLLLFSGVKVFLNHGVKFYAIQKWRENAGMCLDTCQRRKTKTELS